jgi:hypothetical protein
MWRNGDAAVLETVTFGFVGSNPTMPTIVIHKSIVAFYKEMCYTFYMENQKPTESFQEFAKKKTNPKVEGRAMLESAFKAKIVEKTNLIVPNPENELPNLKICISCEGSFTAVNDNQIYCGNAKDKDGCAYKRKLQRHRELNSKWHKEHPGYQMTMQRKYKYGITQEKYLLMVSERNNLCDICNQVDSTNKALCIDHNHKTNEVRGLLCNHCNKALGGFKDSPSILLSAIKYLEKYGHEN